MRFRALQAPYGLVVTRIRQPVRPSPVVLAFFGAPATRPPATEARRDVCGQHDAVTVPPPILQRRATPIDLASIVSMSYCRSVPGGLPIRHERVTAQQS